MPPPSEGLTIYVNLVRSLREDRFFSLVPLRNIRDDAAGGERRRFPSLPVDQHSETSLPLQNKANKKCQLTRLESNDGNIR